MTFFIDASFLFALFNHKDTFHSQALKISHQLEQASARFITSNIALAETVNLIFRTQDRKAATNFLANFRQSKIEEFFLDREVFLSGYQLLFKQKTKKGLNLFDCLHLVAMQKLGLKTMLTFDQAFKKEIDIYPTN